MAKFSDDGDDDDDGMHKKNYIKINVNSTTLCLPPYIFWGFDTAGTASICL